MRKKGSEVKTTFFEALAVTLVCIVAFFGIIYFILMPYIGSHICEQQAKNEEIATTVEPQSMDGTDTEVLAEQDADDAEAEVTVEAEIPEASENTAEESADLSVQ